MAAVALGRATSGPMYVAAGRARCLTIWPLHDSSWLPIMAADLPQSKTEEREEHRKVGGPMPAALVP